MAKPAKIPGIVIDAKNDGEGLFLGVGQSFDEPSGLRLTNNSDKDMYIKSMKYKKVDKAGERTSPMAEMTLRKGTEANGK